MYRKSLIVLALVAAFTVQDVVGGPSPATWADLPNLMTQLTQLVGNLTKTTSTISSGINNLSNLAKNISTVQQTMTNKAVSMATQQFKQLSSLVNLSNLQAAGVNFSQCMNATQINQMNKNLITNVTNCVRSQANKTSQVIQSHVTILRNFSSQIGNLTRSVAKCGINRKCFSNLITSMRTAVMNIPAQMKSYYNNDMKVMELMPLQMSLCSSRIVLQAEKDLATIGMKHVTCAYNILAKKYNTTTTAANTTTTTTPAANTATTTTLAANTATTTTPAANTATTTTTAANTTTTTTTSSPVTAGK